VVSSSCGTRKLCPDTKQVFSAASLSFRAIPSDHPFDLASSPPKLTQKLRKFHTAKPGNARKCPVAGKKLPPQPFYNQRFTNLRNA
jgi:hypothetical protein